MEIKEFKEIVKTLRGIITNTEYDNHVFVVGGCVRDYVLEHKIKDIDLVVDIPNGGIKFANWLFNNHYLVREPVTYPTYSTAMFKLSSYPDIELEAVQTRKERYDDPTNRNPVTAFGTIEEDCYRRDFTTNSLYMKVTTEEILDITGLGLSDIKEKIIRTPLDPMETFSDDPLRIMRAIRFAARYNWNISPETLKGITTNASRLDIISKERIHDELYKMLTSNAEYAFNVMYNTGIVPYIFFDKKYRETYDCFTFRLSCVKCVQRLHNFITVQKPDVYLAVILLHLFNMMLSKSILKMVKKELSLTNETASFLQTVEWSMDYIKRMNDKVFVPEEETRSFIHKFSDTETFLDVLKIADAFGFDTETARIRRIRNMDNGYKWISYKVPVSGNEIMEILNIKPGPQVNEAQNKLLNYVFENPQYAENKEQLIEYLKIEYLL